MLTMFARGGPSSVRIAEGLVTHPLVAREANSVLGYVGANLQPSNTMVSALWQAQTQLNALISMQNNVTASSLVQQLSALLADFNIKLPNFGDPSSSISQQQSAIASLQPGQPTQTELPALFLPSAQPYQVKLADRTYAVTVSPIGARPSLNDLDPRALHDYLVFLGLSDERARALTSIVASWRGLADAHDSAAAQWYLVRPTPYAERGDRIKSWAEAYYLKEMAPDDIDFLSRHFVLNGIDARVDPRFFGADAIAALADIPPDVAAEGLDFVVHPPEQGNATSTPPTLDQVIGAEAAAKFEHAVVMQPGDVEAMKPPTPVIVTVSFAGDTQTYVMSRNPTGVLETLAGDVTLALANPAAPAPAGGVAQ